MTRVLRGVWSRRWTLLPLLLLTVVVVAGTVTVVSFAAAAGTSRLLSVPLLLLGLVAVPGTARELVAARRGEVALARLRGLRGVALVGQLSIEPLLVLVLGGVLGLVIGVVGARVASAVWADGATRTPLGWAAPLTGLGIVVVALVAVTLGLVATLREPLSDQVSTASRPRPASVLAAFGSVLVVVAAVVAVYRSGVTAGAPDGVVLAGPALVGLACGDGVVWLLRLGGRVLVPLTAGRGLGGFLATRRLARVADAVTSVRVLVAAAVVAGLAFTGAQQVSAWTDDTARLRAGAPLQITLDTDASDAIDLTHTLDPHGRYLMAAVLVPGTGEVPNRRVFLDTVRFDSVLGDFYAGTPAAGVGEHIDRLAGQTQGLATGDSVTATVAGTSRRVSGGLHPQVTLGYRNDEGAPSEVQLRLRLGLDGAPATTTTSLAGCTAGCSITQLSLQSRRSESLPWLLTGLQVGGLDAIRLDWQQGDPQYPGGPPSGPVVVDQGLLALAQQNGSESQTIRPASSSAAATKVPILATDTARWTEGPVELDSTGGDERPATVLERYAGLPLVQRDGILADLPRAVAGAPPTVPAAEVMVLARADTPASMLAGLRSEQKGSVRTLADVRDATFRSSRSAQSRMYTLMAGCCLLVALLVLATAVARQRRAWLRDLAALRVVGVATRSLRGAARREVAGLTLATIIGTTVGAVLSVRLLLGHLPLVDVPVHAVPLRTGLALAPLVVAVVAAALVVLVVAGRARSVGAASSRPAILHDDQQLGG